MGRKVAKAFRIYRRIDSERLDSNIKLTFYKALIRFAVTYAYSAWEFATETHLQIQSLNNSTGKYPRRVLFSDIRGACRFRVFTVIQQDYGGKT
jgi:hypothetical protein